MRPRPAAFLTPPSRASAYVPKLTRLQSYTASYNNAPIYSFNVTSFAPNGNVLAATDTANGNWNYSYDQFNRLVCVNLAANGTCTMPPTGTPSYTYVYDRFGNRWQQNGPQTFIASFTGNNTTNNNRMDGYSYDAAGNLKSDGVHSYTYDAENRLLSVDSGNTATYAYDPDGNRVEKISKTGGQNGDPTGTWQFLYDQSGRMLMRFDGALWQGNIYAGSRHVATDGGGTYFEHADWLGTHRLEVTDSQIGNPAYYTYCASLPFGDGLSCRNGNGTPEDNTRTPLRFTGKEHDFESGLDYFGARFDASSFGRFLSPDEAFADQDTHEPQSWNLYAYARNNPTNYTDADGRSCIKDADGNFHGGTCDLGTGTGDTPDKVQVTTQADNSAWGNVTAFGLNAAIGLLNTPGDYFDMLTGLRATPEIPRGQGTSAALGAFIGPFLFPEGEIEDVAKGASAIEKGGQISKGARSIAKKLGHALRGGYKSAFQGSPVTTEKAVALIRDIMSNPARVDSLGKYTDIYNAAGQGVRLEKGTNAFQYFIEGSKAKP